MVLLKLIKIWFIDVRPWKPNGPIFGCSPRRRDNAPLSAIRHQVSQKIANLFIFGSRRVAKVATHVRGNLGKAACSRVGKARAGKGARPASHVFAGISSPKPWGAFNLVWLRLCEVLEVSVSRHKWLSWVMSSTPKMKTFAGKLLAAELFPPGNCTFCCLFCFKANIWNHSNYCQICILAGIPTGDDF